MKKKTTERVLQHGPTRIHHARRSPDSETTLNVRTRDCNSISLSLIHAYLAGYWDVVSCRPHCHSDNGTIQTVKSRIDLTAQIN